MAVIAHGTTRDEEGRESMAECGNRRLCVHHGQAPASQEAGGGGLMPKAVRDSEGSASSVPDAVAGFAVTLSSLCCMRVRVGQRAIHWTSPVSSCLPHLPLLSVLGVLLWTPGVLRVESQCPAP